MKIANLIMMAGVAISVASCGNESANADDASNVDVVMQTLKVDTEASSLGWKGSKSPEYFHTGEVKFTQGSVELVDGNMASGSFTIDMMSVSVNDEQLPDEKKAYLAGHLMSPDFFNAEAHKTVKVTAGALENGQLPITISVMGQEIKDVVPVKLVSSEEGATLTGNFTVDFAAANVPGFAAQEKPEETIQSKIDFTLNVVLK